MEAKEDLETKLNKIIESIKSLTSAPGSGPAFVVRNKQLLFYFEERAIKEEQKRIYKEMIEEYKLKGEVITQEIIEECKEDSTFSAESYLRALGQLSCDYLITCSFGNIILYAKYDMPISTKTPTFFNAGNVEPIIRTIHDDGKARKIKEKLVEIEKLKPEQNRNAQIMKLEDSSELKTICEKIWLCESLSIAHNKYMTEKLTATNISEIWNNRPIQQEKHQIDVKKELVYTWHSYLWRKLRNKATMAKVKKITFKEYEENKMKVMKEESIIVCDNEWNFRRIIWITDPEGGKDKSTFCELYQKVIGCLHLTTLTGVQHIAEIVRARMKAGLTVDTILIDLPRATVDHKIYDTLESLANGKIAASKYKSDMIEFAKPKIIVFSNWNPFEGYYRRENKYTTLDWDKVPNYGKLSRDRWDFGFLEQQDFIDEDGKKLNNFVIKWLENPYYDSHFNDKKPPPRFNFDVD